MNDVLERMRNILKANRGGWPQVTNGTLTEAADEIERLRAERDTLCRAVWELNEEEEVAISLKETLDEIHLCNRLAEIARKEG